MRTDVSTNSRRLLLALKKPALLLIVMTLCAAATQATPPVRSVPTVDLVRYAGTWFEVARFPNWFQKKCTGDVTATYARRPDGLIDVINRCRTGDGQMTEAAGVARVLDGSGNARLKVRFAPALLSWLPFVWGDYWVLGLADDYSWAVVGDPARDYLWVLSRAAHPSEADYQRALDAARANGFDTTRLVRTVQAR